MEKFSIAAIQILSGCNKNIRKNLLGEWYLFSIKYFVEDGNIKKKTDYNLPNNYFSDKINITAIVGKNGSGKSALIELMLRILNNMSAKLLRLESNDLRLVMGVRAILHFEINDRLGYIKADNEDVVICLNGEPINVGWHIDLDKNQYILGGNSVGDITTTKEALTILKELFFTIVSNYSYHSYNSLDFVDESNDSEKVWINGLFHKNDGYLTPIVLNPYRDNGVFNVSKETYLTNNRLAALFYLFRSLDIDFIDGYKLESLSFKFNKSRITDKYRVEYHRTVNGNKYKMQRVKEVTLKAGKRDFFNVTLACILNGRPIVPSLKLAYQYIVAKVFSISAIYPNYKNYIKKEISDLSQYCRESDVNKIKNLVKKLNEDHSHITLKLRQALSFIDYIDSNNCQYEISESYIAHCLKAKYNNSFHAEDILKSLPPSFFDIEINLLETESTSKVKFTKMSSGERQFLFYMSTILYHLRNLDSVINGAASVHYKFINIVLEEVELYFHPEYQQKLISKLIEYIEKTIFHNIKYINVMIVTHSPFVLSDIPKDNILFVKNGYQTDLENGDFETLGANIHDLLKHNFFLSNGLIGDFISRRINEIADDIQKQEDSRKWNNEQILYLINAIGEPIIKEALIEMYGSNIRDNSVEALTSEIEKLQRKIFELKSKK